MPYQSLLSYYSDSSWDLEMSVGNHLMFPAFHTEPVNHVALDSVFP